MIRRCNKWKKSIQLQGAAQKLHRLLWRSWPCICEASKLFQQGHHQCQMTHGLGAHVPKFLQSTKPKSGANTVLYHRIKCDNTSHKGRPSTKPCFIFLAPPLPSGCTTKFFVDGQVSGVLREKNKGWPRENQYQLTSSLFPQQEKKRILFDPVTEKICISDLTWKVPFVDWQVLCIFCGTILVQRDQNHICCNLFSFCPPPSFTGTHSFI